MKELSKTYDPKNIEQRLYDRWVEKGYFKAKVDPDLIPLSCLRQTSPGSSIWATAWTRRFRTS